MFNFPGGRNILTANMALLHRTFHYLPSVVLIRLNCHWKKNVVALLFYIHGKHLRSCQDGQLT